MRKISIFVLIFLLVATLFFVSCEKKYKIGDEGPAGGMIFYVDEEDKYPEWDYLETSTGENGIGEYKFGFYYVDGSMKTVGTETDVGTGKRNTEKLVAAMGEAAWGHNGNRNVSEYAAKMCADYEQNGYDDWFLPSYDELNLVYQNLQVPGLLDLQVPGIILEVQGSWCWSSSEYNEYYAWYQSFDHGGWSSNWRGSDLWCVRPVRAFSDKDPEPCQVNIISDGEPDIEPINVRKGGSFPIPDRSREYYKLESVSDQYGNIYSEGQRIVVDGDLDLTYNWVPAEFAYGIGDEGPAGGIVFYVDIEDILPEYDYMETITDKDGIGNYQFGYYYVDGSQQRVGTEYGIGAGRRNTEKLVAAMGETAWDSSGNRTVPEYAAKMAYGYQQNGYDDWFLPSKGELDLVYQNLQELGLYKFSGSWCWSSSEDYTADAWGQGFDSGYQYSYNIRSCYNCVRPVRAFSKGDPVPETCLISIFSQEELDIEPLKVRKGGKYIIPKRNREGFKVENISDQYGNTYSELQEILVDRDLALTYNWKTFSYKIGDQGPAGGKIFYVDEGDEYPEWDYLEASTGEDGIGEYQFGYCYVDGSRVEVGTETGVGAGERNTEKLVAAMGDGAWDNSGNRTVSEYAAKMADSYEKNGYDDWFLPSKDELDLMYQNLQEPGLSKFSSSWCWSSSEYGISTAWNQGFGDGSQDCYSLRGNNYYSFVRPVRAFSEDDPEPCQVTIISEGEPDIEPINIGKGSSFSIPDRGREFYKLESVTDQYGKTYSEGQRIVVDGDLTLTYNWKAFSYKIGDMGPAGGMIFYVDVWDKYPGWDYLETSMGKDGIGEYEFGEHGKLIFTEKGIGKGKSNTEKLVRAHDNGWYAAKMCADYSVTRGGVVYDDWFLPSKDELNLVYQNLQKPGLSGFSGSWCWSSSQYDYSNGIAWKQFFDDGGQYGSSDRHDYSCVRPVRAF